MKNQIKELLEKSIQQAFPEIAYPEIQVTVPKDKNHGDFSSNIAMLLCKALKTSPQNIAKQLINNIEEPWIEKVELAGPGFINLFVSSENKLNLLTPIIQKHEDFFSPNVGQGQSVHIEFVSANPTGPLHVGHGRGAAIGSTIAKILEGTGFKVHKEYYVNDIGLQMDTLATSLWLRYLQLNDVDIQFPDKAYQGEYLIKIANDFNGQFNDQFVFSFDESPNELEAWINLLKSLSSQEQFSTIKTYAYTAILEDIKEDLTTFRVHYDHWYHESSMLSTKVMDNAFNKLRKTPYVYEKEQALWFKSTEFEDDKDRVLVRSSGVLTYFASDVAYHYDKFNKGFDHVVDLFGSDHHGYIPRVKASMKALGCDVSKYRVKLVQFATLFRGNEQISMSTRSGEFITLRELYNEVGVDATRYYYVSRKADQHVNFDLELAKSKSNENPVFYIQYAHARICSVLKKCNFSSPSEHTDQLSLESELQLIQQLSQYPEKLTRCAKLLEPHHLTNYLHEIAGLLHSYYNQTRVQVEDLKLQNARLTLIFACKEVIAHGLNLLSISAPESM